MTTETTTVHPISTPTTSNSSPKMTTSHLSTLEERKGNAIKPLSLRPNRSVKKNLSLKPLGLRSR